METKRPLYDEKRYVSAKPTGSNIDEELRRQLATVGQRARKQVSEGHLTLGTSIPSFNGLTTGTLDQNQIRQQMAAKTSVSMNDVISKRPRSEVWDDDEYGGGDTEDDEETTPQIQNKHSQFYPFSQKSRSSFNEDFKEAQFLKPQE